VRKTAVTLADGRELIYYGDQPEDPLAYPDRRRLEPMAAASQLRFNQLLGEWLVVAGHRQNRTYRPADDQCPLCPSTPASLTEIPAPTYDVVVFENRFPALAAGPRATPAPGSGAPLGPGCVFPQRPAAGRSEVICFSPQHDASFADLPPSQVASVMAAWTDRSTELPRLPGVEQVICFENRGREIGATLSHPHGQIHAYPFVVPRTASMLDAVTAWRHRTGGNLFDDIVAAERADGSRVVADGQHWLAFVPFSARWPYEVHLYPSSRVPDLASLPEAAREEFTGLYPDLLRRFDRLFGVPAPYISAWHQAPVRRGREEFAAHLELFTIMRAPGKLKHLAGAESAMGTFSTDVVPEAAAERLRQLG
jgi:UDPglucose--hexose-1-phosphate uridylyltransferase